MLLIAGLSKCVGGTVRTLSCPQAAEMSGPLGTRMVQETPALVRTPVKSIAASCVAGAWS